MALTLTYAEIRRELGRFLAIGENPVNWSADDSTRVEDIIRRGSRRFYFPDTSLIEDAEMSLHAWSFIQDAMTVSLTVATTYHDLPSDFVRLVSRPSITASDRPLEWTTEDNIRNLDNAGAGEGYPAYYTIERKKPSSEALAYTIGLHPQPFKAMTLTGDYVFEPAEPSMSQAPIVGVDHAETYLAALIATADEIMNPETSDGSLMQKFIKMLATSLRRDMTIGVE